MRAFVSGCAGKIQSHITLLFGHMCTSNTTKLSLPRVSLPTVKSARYAHVNIWQ